MKTNEQWIRWAPSEKLQKTYNIISISRSIKESLTIILCEENDENITVTLLFNGRFFTYRETEELYVHYKMSQICQKQYGVISFDTNFFKILNSEYIDWISRQSGGLNDNQNIQHFAIFAENSLIEILAIDEPQIIFNDNNYTNKA